MTQELCGAIMLPGRHWGPDRCILEKGHDVNGEWHFGERGSSWDPSVSVKEVPHE